MNPTSPQAPPLPFRPLPPDVEARLHERARWLTFLPFAALCAVAWWHEAATLEWLAERRLLEIGLPLIAIALIGGFFWLLNYGQWIVLRWLSDAWRRRHHW